MAITTVIGAFFGDEGKGKQIAAFAEELSRNTESFFSKVANKEIIGYGIRVNGGPNGGHALVENGVKVSGHVVPSTILYPRILSIIGAGCAINLAKLAKEINDFREKGFFRGSLVVDGNAQIIIEAYEKLDGLRNGRDSTGSGISDVFGHKGKRDGIRARDLLDQRRLAEKVNNLIPTLYAEMYEITRKKLGVELGDPRIIEDENYLKFVRDYSIENIMNSFNEYQNLSQQIISNEIADELRDAVHLNKPILSEGSQSYYLGIDSGLERGSSSVINPSGIFVTQGIPQMRQRIVAVTKAFFSRVGNGYFVGEFGDRSKAVKKGPLLMSLGLSEDAPREEYLQMSIDMMRSDDPQKIGDGLRLFYGEFGETTKFPRGKSPFDLVAMRSLFKQIARGSQNEIELHINQMDGLEHFDRIPIITEYAAPDGKRYRTIPAMNDWRLKQLTPIVQYLPSWEKKLEGAYEQWPNAAKDFINFIEIESGFRVGGIGNGPEAKDIIKIPRR